MPDICPRHEFYRRLHISCKTKGEYITSEELIYAKCLYVFTFVHAFEKNIALKKSCFAMAQSLSHTQSQYESSNSTEPYSYFKPKGRWLSCLPKETMLRGLSSLCVCMLTGKFQALWPFLTNTSTFLAKRTESSSVSWGRKKKKYGWLSRREGLQVYVIISYPASLSTKIRRRNRKAREIPQSLEMSNLQPAVKYKLVRNQYLLYLVLKEQFFKHRRVLIWLNENFESITSSKNLLVN